MVSKKETKKALDELREQDRKDTEHRASMKDAESRVRLEADKAALQRKNRDLELQLEEYKELNDLVERLQANPSRPKKIKRREKSSRIMEATGCLLLSDLHFEEEVKPEEVNGKNEFNLDIAKERCDRLSTGFEWYLQTVRSSYKVRDLFVPMLGDNISNFLRDEDMVGNLLGPFEALTFARDRLIEIYDRILADDQVESVFVPVVVGNHDRMPGTRKNPHAGRTNLSLAYLLADQLSQHYRKDERIEFELSHSAAHYTEIYGHTIRSMHGDNFAYNKGVGGIYVGAKRQIARMDATKQAHLTVFGHHHQFKVDRDWISNGCLIGWNAFAANLGFEFEPAGQVAFILDRDRGKRMPVLLQVQSTDTWA